MPNLSANPVAYAQAAMHRAELLLTRCRSSNSPLLPSTTPQAHWHDARQQQFLTWLEAGGFSQIDQTMENPIESTIDSTIENSGIAPLFSAPERDSNEESKFSLVRINDAVE
jgi:hypothetical protein